jgi:hypothetical protein
MNTQDGHAQETEVVVVERDRALYCMVLAHDDGGRLSASVSEVDEVDVAAEVEAGHEDVAEAEVEEDDEEKDERAVVVPRSEEGRLDIGQAWDDEVSAGVEWWDVGATHALNRTTMSCCQPSDGGVYSQVAPGPWLGLYMYIRTTPMEDKADGAR